MKIVTFNINNINKRLDNLVAWLSKTEPDVVCLQELKAEQQSFPERALRALGYRSVWQGERSWNGVAILVRDQEPILTRSSLPGNPEDSQARYIEAAVNGVLISSIYLPNGNPQPGLKFNYKLAWFERLITHAAEFIAAGVPVVLAGDYNVVPTVQDIYPTRSLDNNALIQPESRQAFARLLAQGWTDALRRLHPEGPLWTFWDYERDRWRANKGMRLDHFLLSSILCERLVDGGVDKWVRGEATPATTLRRGSCWNRATNTRRTGRPSAEVSESGKYTKVNEGALEEIIAFSGQHPLHVLEFLHAVGEMQERKMNFLYGRVRQKHWDGAVALDRLFEGEHIPDDPQAYLDQRYIDYLATNSEEMGKIHWRNFERLTTEFFRRQGYEVNLGAGTKDGGVDVRIWTDAESRVGPPLMLIQCKRYKDVVGIETIKAFWTDVHFEGAENGLIATTSSVSRESKKICAARKWPLNLAEAADVRKWARTMWRHAPAIPDED